MKTGFPKTREELERAGYKFSGFKKCGGVTCSAEIEWWTTPKGKAMPFDRMPNPDSPAITHFATCPDAPRFKA